MKSKLKITLLAVLLFSVFNSFGQAFVTTWNMGNTGAATGQLAFNVQTVGGTVAYTWTSTGSPSSGSGTIAANYTGIVNIPVSTAGIVTLNLGTGSTETNLKRFYLANANDRLRLTAVTQWGGAQWTSMLTAFQGCSNLTTVSTVDVPNLTATNINFQSMFENCSALNAGNFNGWATNNVNNMNRMFNNATAFNLGLTAWNVGNVTDFTFMFSNSAYNQPLNAWNIGANVAVGTPINMNGMFFLNTAFNQVLNNWDVSKVTIMGGMFQGATAFNQDLSSWNVSAVTNFGAMFSGATAYTNGGVSLANWNPVAATNMASMFQQCKYNSPLNVNWCGAALNGVLSMSQMFSGNTVFNQDISCWDVSTVTNFQGMFNGATAFNQNIGGWNVSASTTFQNMFNGATAFNQNIGAWNVSNATTFQSMFQGATAYTNNGATLSNWKPDAAIDLSNMFNSCRYNMPLNNNWCGATLNGVTTMSGMFQSNTVFNQDISCWDVSTVTNFQSMFNGATAYTNNGQTLNTWKPDAATDMSLMFAQSRYNMPLNGNWCVGAPLNGVLTMKQMFTGNTAFNQDISCWDVSTVTDFSSMFSGATAYANAGQPLDNWNPVAATDMSSMFQSCRYNSSLANTWCGGTLNGVTTMASMFANNTVFNQDISCWDVSTVTNFQSMFSGATAYTNGGQSLGNWNPVAATNLSFMFQSCRYNSPLGNNWCGGTLNGVTTMASMFASNTVFNQDISCWDVSTVTTFASMFQGATAYNQSLCGWNVSVATTFDLMFSGATAFNNGGIPLSCWTPTAATSMGSMFAASAYNLALAGGWCGGTLTGMNNMGNMFLNNTVFNQDLSCWDVSTVTNFSGMFQGATAFNQNLCAWNVSAGLNFGQMFQGATAFKNNNTALSCWIPSSATSMNSMFQQSTYNLPLNGGWNGTTLKNVTNMSSMFTQNTVFNQDLSGWDVSKVANFTSMFATATAFNNAGVNLADSWNTISATNMTTMFNSASAFNQSLAGLEINAVTNMTNMLGGSGLSEANYDATLIGWQAAPHKTNVALGATGRTFCASSDQRRSLIVNDGWTITNDTQSCTPGGVFTNLTWWLDATRLTTKAGINVTNGSVDSWGNRVIVTNVPNNYVQGITDNQPTVVANSLNFNPVMRFDGGSTFLKSATATSSGYRGAAPLNQYSVFMVGRFNNTNTIIAHDKSTIPVVRSTVTAQGIRIDSALTAENYNATTTMTGLQIGAYVYQPRSTVTPFASGSFKAFLNGNANGTTVTGKGLLTSTGDYMVGANAAGTDFFNGDLGEVIFYSSSLMDAIATRRKIESYLSIKWGTTLAKGTAYDYHNSQGVTIWTGNATYQNNIGGIGRDDGSGLNQKQSQSQNGGVQMVMALNAIAADNVANTNTFNSNSQFLIWGDDNGSITNAVGVAGLRVNSRLARVWSVQNTGTFNQQVTVYYPSATLNTLFGKLPKYLIYSNAANFAGTTKAQVKESGTAMIDGTEYVAFALTFPTGVGNLFTTFGTIRQVMVNPGGISINQQNDRIKQ